MTGGKNYCQLINPFGDDPVIPNGVSYESSILQTNKRCKIVCTKKWLQAYGDSDDLATITAIKRNRFLIN